MEGWSFSPINPEKGRGVELKKNYPDRQRDVTTKNEL